jgi:hypothetical protein
MVGMNLGELAACILCSKSTVIRLFASEFKVKEKVRGING